MKKNPLSVWTFSYRKSYYLTHPWKWFKDLYRNIRNFWHRGHYGFAYVDVWDFCKWYPRVGAEALRYLAKHNNGYPAMEQWKTMEEWREYLEYLADRLQRCADSMDICFGKERNEYYEAYSKSMPKPEKELIDKYLTREKEINDADQEYNETTWKWLGEDLGNLWD